MKGIIVVFILLSNLLLSQEYHIKGCDERFYKLKTRRVLSLDTIIKYKSCEERRRHFDGKYYFYHDSLSKHPYLYQVYKNGKTTYKKRVGNRKKEVRREFRYLTYYDNGSLKSEKGCDTGAFDWRKNVFKYYDSLGDLYWKWRLSLKGIDEHGNVIENTELLILNKGDTIRYTLGYGTGENADNGYHYLTTKIKEYDTITKKQIVEKQITHINKATDFGSYYWLDDTTIFKFNEKREVISRTQDIFVSSNIYKKKVSYINDSLVFYQIELKQDFNFNDSDCNYVELHSNGVPSYLKLNYCGQDSLIASYDSTGEETHREEYYETKGSVSKRFTYLFKPNREQYLIKKKVCKRKRCKVWLYNDKGKLLSVKRTKRN